MIFTRSVFTATVLAAMLVLMFGMGTVTGASIAHNQTASLDSAITELQTTMETAEQNMRENTTGWKQTLTLQLWHGIERPAMWAVTSGLKIGHAYPISGRAMGYLGPVVAIGLMGGATWRQYKQYKRR